jgi:hypothetical protein
MSRYTQYILEQRHDVKYKITREEKILITQSI